MKRVLGTILLALTYAILSDPGSLLDWLIGSAIAIAIASVLASADTWRPRGIKFAMVDFPLLILGISLEVARGSWQMMRILVGRQAWTHAAFVEIENAAETSEGLILLAFVQSASPGSVAADIDEESRSLTMSAIDGHDAEERRAQVHDFYARYQRRAVP